MCSLTDHGPLLDPVFTRDSRPIALKWTLYDTTLNSIPLYAMNTASNWTEFTTALRSGAGPHKTSSTPTTRATSPTTPSAEFRFARRAVQACPSRHSVHEWQGYIPFDDMPNTFDPPSGFLATANSRVTSDKSKYPLTNEWADPYRAERIYKLLAGPRPTQPRRHARRPDRYLQRDGSGNGHRLAYAIDHTAGADDRLHKAADLMRSWDGRLTTDSAAASLVTQTRYASGTMILEPKLGKEDADDYRWSESNFAEEEIVMHANPDWLPPATRTGTRSSPTPSARA